MSSGVSASTAPSGERLNGQVSVEPAYDDTTGNLIFLGTPIHAPNPTNNNAQANAPLWLVVYPNSNTAAGALNCQDVPTENCPDHGPEIAGLAMSFNPNGAYDSGVRGHDHLVAPPASGGDWNVAWDVHVILFTDPTFAATAHLTTLQEINDAISNHEAMDSYNITGSIVVFDCAVVPAATYE